MPFYNVTSVTHSLLNSINTINFTGCRRYLGGYLGDILGISLGYLGDIFEIFLGYLRDVFGIGVERNRNQETGSFQELLE